jgi:hypothetical protein
MQVLGAVKIYDSGSGTFLLSKERFFDLGGVWGGVAKLVEI